jgi:cell division protein FtsB
MQSKNKYQQKISNFIDRLSDLNFAAQIFFVVFVLLLSWSGIKTIQSNYNLQKQISELNQQNDVMRLKNDNLRLQNEYYKSDQFLELSARRNFGLATPGEKMLIVPKSVALANVSDVKLDDFQSASPAKKSKLQNNAQAWLDFFLNHSNKP